MKYDMASKKADRLLRKNWQKVCQEAHRIGGLGLPLEVRVEEGMVEFTLYPETLNRGARVTLRSDGGIYSDILIQWQDGHWEKDQYGFPEGKEAVAEILAMTLEEADNLAQRMGEAAQILAAASIK